MRAKVRSTSAVPAMVNVGVFRVLATFGAFQAVSVGVGRAVSAGWTKRPVNSNSR